MATLRSVLRWFGVSTVAEVVQSIIALVLTLVLAYMVVAGRSVDDAVLAMYAAVISFYFGQRVGNSNTGGA